LDLEKESWKTIAGKNKLASETHLGGDFSSVIFFILGLNESFRMPIWLKKEASKEELTP